jgi:hypothetical protein
LRFSKPHFLYPQARAQQKVLKSAKFASQKIFPYKNPSFNTTLENFGNFTSKIKKTQSPEKL